MFGRVRELKLVKAISDPNEEHAGENYTNRRLATSNRAIGIGDLSEPVYAPTAFASRKRVDSYNVLFYNGKPKIRKITELNILVSY